MRGWGGGVVFLAMQVLEIPAGGRGFPLVCSKHSIQRGAITISWTESVTPRLRSSPCSSTSRQDDRIPPLKSLSHETNDNKLSTSDDH